MNTPLLEVKSLYKTFHLHILNNKKIEALENVSFSMNKGEIVGLIGKSGSGKSSLMKCIYRTYLPSSGEILFNSDSFGLIDIAKATDHEILQLRKNDITYCSQFLHVIPRVSALNVVASGAVNRGISKEEALEKANDLLQQLGLPEDLKDAFPSTFSGGEQQRINIARAIIAPPKLLVIDEPTSSLDLKTKNVVIDIILKLKDKGVSVLCISHDQHTLDTMCDRLVAMENGQIAEKTQTA
jgi:alpha-D-ribose 1-methylphosphonate 5-triphosphate synthase subunit PhnL